MKSLTLSQLEQLLNELLECNALELIPDSTPSEENLYIPYMMNDALENYFILKDCQIIGSFTNFFKHEVFLEIIQSNSSASEAPRNALILHKNNGEILTVWFSDCFQVLNFYQYHRIGHFWRKGQEHWRRLVYIIGTLHEKYTYLGASSCNELELSLLPLVEFAPFRYWSPIHESLDEYYINSEEGLFSMYQLALESGDRAYAFFIKFYQKFPFSFVEHFLAKRLVSPKCKSLYELICRKIDMASCEYSIRDYGEKRNTEIEKIRTQFTQQLYAEGFHGQYPDFYKENIKLTAMEEHPFTILESEDFTFKIYRMVTE